MRANEFLRQGVTEGFLDKFIKPKKVKPEMIMNIKKGNGELYVEVYMGEDSTYWIARFTFDMTGDTLKAQDISVTDEYRGRGIAKWVYDTLKNKGYTINRSPYQTDDGKHFWDKNKGANAKVWEQGVAEGTSNITYKQQKGKNKFSIEMSVDGRSAGIFQYDADTGRTLVELDPVFRGQGLGQRLILKGIYTAAMLGMNYVEDESRTQMFDRAMDSLADAGYIVQDEEYWYVTDSGKQFLKQRVAEGTLI